MPPSASATPLSGAQGCMRGKAARSGAAGLGAVAAAPRCTGKGTPCSARRLGANLEADPYGELTPAAMPGLGLTGALGSILARRGAAGCTSQPRGATGPRSPRPQPVQHIFSAASGPKTTSNAASTAPLRRFFYWVLSFVIPGMVRRPVPGLRLSLCATCSRRPAPLPASAARWTIKEADWPGPKQRQHIYIPSPHFPPLRPLCCRACSPRPTSSSPWVTSRASGRRSTPTAGPSEPVGGVTNIHCNQQRGWRAAAWALCPWALPPLHVQASKQT